MDVLIGVGVFLVCMGLPFLVVYVILPYRRTLKKARDLFNKNKFAESIELFNRCLKKYPDDPTSLSLRAQAYSNIEDHIKAENDILKALSLKPADDKLMKNAGYIFARSQNYSIAITYLDNVLNVKEDHFAYFVRAYSYAKLGKFDLAFQDYTKLINIKPDSAVGYHGLGSVYIHYAEFEKAIINLDKSIKLDPKSGPTFADRGFAYANLKDFKKAFDDFETSYDLDPDNPELYEFRGKTYLMTENYSLALKDLEKALDLDPSLTNDLLSTITQCKQQLIK